MWKNWDGVKVYTVSAQYVEHVEFEHLPDNERIVSLKSAINALQREEGAGNQHENSKRSTQLVKLNSNFQAK